MTERMEGRSGATQVIKCTVTAGEDLELGGRVEGTIRVPGHVLTLAPGAEVTADVQAHTVVVSGAVKGDVRATEKVVLNETGVVSGDIRSPRVEMHEGARLEGRIDMPARLRAVSAA
jgi:cytoskeletal protein CcmA (bactofilin family)